MTQGYSDKVVGHFTVDFDELTKMGVVERDITMTCVSNEVGGDLVGAARWLGVPLTTVLDRAGVGTNAYGGASTFTSDGSGQ